MLDLSQFVPAVIGFDFADFLALNYLCVQQNRPYDSSDIDVYEAVFGQA